MYFAKTLIVCASLISAAVSQSRIAFTVLPSSITAGKDVTLHWGGGDGSAVTLTLQQGTTDNLKTVELVAGDVTGDSYTWSVPKNLPDGTNYALRIQQGDTEPNYTGMITVTGGAPSGSTFSGSGSGSGSSSASSSASVSATASSSASASANASASNNSTASVTSKPTLVGTASSAGTGISMQRNTTMSHATLTASSASSKGSNTNVGGSGGSPTASTSAPASTKTGGAIALVASNFALVVCAVAGIVLLG